MKNLIIPSFAMAGLLAVGFSLSAFRTAEPMAAVPVAETFNLARTVAYKVDVSQSTITWNAKKVTGEHNGGLKIAKGEVLADKAKVIGGSVDMDMTSISDVDKSDRLVNHLKSDDFFSSEKFPVATFKITSAVPVKGAKAGTPNFTVHGNLTIKGITNAISFPATISVKGNTLTANSDAISIDRTKFDIKYRSASFFSTIGDKAIEDKFTVKFNLVAKAGSDMAKL